MRRLGAEGGLSLQKSSASILVIPETSPTRYISGVVAPNIPCANGTGDWHEEDVFFTPGVSAPRSFTIESGQPFDPSALLGSAGVYDASAALDSIGVKHPDGPVYAASHARAIADLAIASVLRGEMLDYIGLDDWMPRDDDKAEVLALLKPVVRLLSERQADALNRWIAANDPASKAALRG